MKYTQNIPDITVGAQVVGSSHPPLVLPDIDMFFNGDLDIASKLIECVRKAGLSTIKTAILEDPEIVFNNGEEETFLNKDGTITKTNYRELIRKKILTRKQHKELFSLVRKNELQMVSSVYDIESVKFAADEGAVAIKIPSSNITHKILIEETAKTRLPIILDTGKSTITEIIRAVTWAKQITADAIGLMSMCDNPACYKTMNPIRC